MTLAASQVDELSRRRTLLMNRMNALGLDDPDQAYLLSYLGFETPDQKPPLEYLGGGKPYAPVAKRILGKSIMKRIRAHAKTGNLGAICKLLNGLGEMHTLWLMSALKVSGPFSERLPTVLPYTAPERIDQEYALPVLIHLLDVREVS